MKKNLIFKIFSVILASLFILSCFAACGNKSDVPSEEITTTIVESTTEEVETTKTKENIETTANRWPTVMDSENNEEKTTEEKTTISKAETTTKKGPPVEAATENQSLPDKVIAENIDIVDNTIIYHVKNSKIIALTMDRTYNNEDLKDVQEKLFNAAKTNTSKYCVIEKYTPISEFPVSTEGLEGYFSIGFAKTKEFSESYMINATVLYENIPCNCIIIYDSNVSMDNLMNEVQKDMVTFAELIKETYTFN